MNAFLRVVRGKAAAAAGVLVVLGACLACAGPRPAAAQAPGTASFNVIERGVPIGTVEVSIARDGEGWRIRSTADLAGTPAVTVEQFDAQYDANWRARFLTVERVPHAHGSEAPRAATIVHVAVGRSIAHTDIVSASEVHWRSHSVSPDTVFLPDFAYGAFAAVAARLHAAGPQAELPLLRAPDGERRAVVAAWEAVTVETSAGPVRANRHTLMLIGVEPVLIHVWEEGGRLLRVDLPAEGISVVRNDLVSP